MEKADRQCKRIRRITCGDFEDIDFSGKGNVSPGESESGISESGVSS